MGNVESGNGNGSPAQITKKRTLKKQKKLTKKQKKAASKKLLKTGKKETKAILMDSDLDLSGSDLDNLDSPAGSDNEVDNDELKGEPSTDAVTELKKLLKPEEAFDSDQDSEFQEKIEEIEHKVSNKKFKKSNNNNNNSSNKK